MATKKKHSKNSKHSTPEEAGRTTFSVKTYGFNYSDISERNPENIIDKDAWQEGACMVASGFLAAMIAPKKWRKKTIHLAHKISLGLPKNLVVQAMKAVEDLVQVGESGHFVLGTASQGIIKFDTSTDASSFISKNAGAVPANEDHIHAYLMERAHSLVFVV